MSFLEIKNQLHFKDSEFNISNKNVIQNKIAKALDESKIVNEEIYFKGFKYFRSIDSGKISLKISQKELEINSLINFHYSFYLICCAVILLIIISFENISFSVFGVSLFFLIFIFSKQFSKWILKRIINKVMMDFKKS